MERKLIIEDFGKIRKAKIDISPLTLFVGDNNSGKSYLLSLIWGIYAAEEESVVFHNAMELLAEDYPQVYKDICDLILKAEAGEKQKIKILSDVPVRILNALLEQSKDKFVAGIFNSEQVTIGKLAQPFRLRVIIPSISCNSAIEYCTESSKSFHGSSSAFFIMSSETLATETIFNSFNKRSFIF